MVEATTTALRNNVGHPSVTMTFSIPAFMRITPFTTRLRCFPVSFATNFTALALVATVEVSVTRLVDAALARVLLPRPIMIRFPWEAAWIHLKSIDK